MTDHARVVVIGGGAVGASVLYHLAVMGWTDAILVERDELTSGSTWHADRQLPELLDQLQRHQAAAVFDCPLRQARRGGRLPINYHVTGSLRLAHTADRMDEFRHVAGMAQAQGLAFEVLSPQEAQALYPFLELHDLQGALWDPLDGDIDPSQLTQAYAKGARDLGAKVKRFTKVTGLARLDSGQWRVTTDKGEILCSTSSTPRGIARAS